MLSKGLIKTGEQAMTLVELVVGVGIAGILIWLGFSAISNEAQTQAKIDDQVNRVKLFREILFAIDCDATSVNNCSTSPYIRLNTAVPGQPPIVRLFDPANPNASTKIGDYFVRAKCTPNHKINIEIQNSKKSNAAWTDITDKIPIGCYMP